MKKNFDSNFPFHTSGVITHLPSGIDFNIKVDHLDDTVEFDVEAETVQTAIENAFLGDGWHDFQGEQWLSIITDGEFHFILLDSNSDDEPIIELSHFYSHSVAALTASWLCKACQYVRDNCHIDDMIVNGKMVHGDSDTSVFVDVYNKSDCKEDLLARLPFARKVIM